MANALQLGVDQLHRFFFFYILSLYRLFFYTLLLKQLHNSKKKKPTIINASQVEDDVLRFFGHKIDVNVKGAVQVVLLHEKNDTWWERY